MLCSLQTLSIKRRQRTNLIYINKNCCIDQTAILLTKYRQKCVSFHFNAYISMQYYNNSSNNQFEIINKNNKTDQI